jgi:hypothetical protein
MARKNKQKYVPKSFESTGSSSDTSANIYVSMLMSERWQSLTKNAQVLYVYCKAQYYAEKKKPTPQVKEVTESERTKCFTMNKSKWKDLYGIYKSDNGQFNKDMKMLIENGFVKIVENGSITRTKTIYCFSDEWRKP